MFKPRLLAMVTAVILFSCRETISPSDTQDRNRKTPPSVSAPTEPSKDTLRLSPAKREPRNIEIEKRKKKRDTLKPVTT